MKKPLQTNNEKPITAAIRTMGSGSENLMGHPEPLDDIEVTPKKSAIISFY
ncbi:MAG: hypothetical protein PSV17_00625 [Methylotenera sp.]|uniref:hypothetical protein n=1 Tax=Methylotenera sp. TaxID=2051956 RepID=UPI0024894153|nr:hypothetical protein [Methylotenera sp.]MDI1299597.1 hypothetical protein [Methylotenera sp.]MDI1307921.1 hypothetical protein [Methylotenera sp.]